MRPRFLLTPALLLLLACPKAPPPPIGEAQKQIDRRLWYAVQDLASQAEALLAQQEEMIWKNWTEGTPADIAKTYEGKDKLFSSVSIQMIDQLRKSSIAAYQCTAVERGEPPQCPKDAWGSLEVRALTYLHVYFVGEHLSAMLVDQSDAIANLEASLTFTAAGKEYHYRDLDRLLAVEKDPEKRQALYLGATRAVERISLLARRKDERAEALLKELGYPSYESFGEAIRYGNMDEIAQFAEQVLELTQNAYAKAMDRVAQRELHTPFEKLRRADIPRLFKPQNMQFFFPKDELLSRAQSTLKGLGFELSAMKNIRLDLRELTYKNPRPLTVSVAIPGDVRVSLKPTGGARDQAALLHELGLALRFASMKDPDQAYPAGRAGFKPDLRFELTRLGSGAVAQAFAILFEQLVEDPEWLQQNASLTGQKLQSQLMVAHAHRLYQVRRRAGKLLYDVAVHRGEEPDARAVYHRIMSRAYGLAITTEDDARYVVDRDELYQPADDLRAWLIARQLQQTLKKRFGASWWRSPRAGDLLRELWSKGGALYPQEIATSVDAATSTDELLRSFAAACSGPAETRAEAETAELPVANGY
ncbi:MAG TPA: chromosome segregation protein SMC [Myxococcaceae bacterium]|nr:chromosome segregation protein SMC [Myxococcaceae bacterium]